MSNINEEIHKMCERIHRNCEEIRKDCEEIRKDCQETRKHCQETRKDYEEINKIIERIRPLNSSESPESPTITYKRLKNDFFPWMWDIYEKEDIGQGLGRDEPPPNSDDIDTWHMIWVDKSTQKYTYDVYIFWKTTKEKYGYDSYIHDAYDDGRDMHFTYMFDSLEEMKCYYKTNEGNEPEWCFDTQFNAVEKL